MDFLGGPVLRHRTSSTRRGVSRGGGGGFDPWSGNPHALWHSQKNRKIKYNKIKKAWVASHSRTLGLQDIRVKTVIQCQ